MSKLDIRIRSKPHAGSFREAIMTLTGSLNATTAPKFEKEMASLLVTRPQRIVLETAALEHIHGEVLETLCNAHWEQRRHDGEFLIVNKHHLVESIQIHTSEVDGVQVVKLGGHLDIRGVGRIEADFLRVFEISSPQVVIDLSTADSLSSLGIRMLLQGIKNAAARGGRILICNPAPPVSSALETAGLGQFVARGDEHDIVAGLRQ